MYYFKSKFITFGFLILIHTWMREESHHCKSLGFYSKTFNQVMCFGIKVGSEQTKTSVRSQASSRQAGCLRQGRTALSSWHKQAWPQEPPPASSQQQGKKQGEKKKPIFLVYMCFPIEHTVLPTARAMQHNMGAVQTVIWDWSLNVAIWTFSSVFLNHADAV